MSTRDDVFVTLESTLNILLLSAQYLVMKLCLTAGQAHGPGAEPPQPFLVLLDEGPAVRGRLRAVGVVAAGLGLKLFVL